MSSVTFTTPTGVKGRTSTRRRYIVVIPHYQDPTKAVVVARSDNPDTIAQRARQYRAGVIVDLAPIREAKATR